jgi:hypothetical protein
LEFSFFVEGSGGVLSFGDAAEDFENFGVVNASFTHSGHKQSFEWERATSWRLSLAPSSTFVIFDEHEHVEGCVMEDEMSFRIKENNAYCFDKISFMVDLDRAACGD